MKIKSVKFNFIMNFILTASNFIFPLITFPYVSRVLGASGTGKVSEEKLVELVNKNFDLRPGAIIRDLDLRKPIYKQVAAYGHFGRNDLDLPWERTDKAEILRKEALGE